MPPLTRRGSKAPSQPGEEVPGWGPYLSMRQWGGVREDYSATGDAWDYFPFSDAARRAFRWGEDGLLGVSDARQRICLGLGLWNGKDSILKERMFGLTNQQGNHGEDVKEYWHYLDALPDGSYLRAVYRYPMERFPYEELVRRNAVPGPEIGLLDLGAFDDDRYWSVEVEYALANHHTVAWRVRVTNHSSNSAGLHLLAQLWFRNCWSWDQGAEARRPSLSVQGDQLHVEHPDFSGYRLRPGGEFSWLVCDNESDRPALFGEPPSTSHPKDRIGRAVLEGNPSLCNPLGKGTKGAAHYQLTVPAGATRTVRLLFGSDPRYRSASVDGICERRRRAADHFYQGVHPPKATAEERRIQRQAFAGLIWSQQYYEYDVSRWLSGDPVSAPPPDSRLQGRNAGWGSMRAADIVLMPDSWEYPWFASWDLAFHAMSLEPVNPELAKEQLLLLLEPRYLREDGQLPAYEWSFGDCNPPVHAHAIWQLYVRERNRTGTPDRAFLERAFLALLFNYGWWVNRRDTTARDIFSGGFLGLDNISPVDRSHLPEGAELSQADATAWMGMFTVKMFRIAAELAIEEPQYEDMALRFFQHFTNIAAALNGSSGEGGLWNEVDGFYYDCLRLADGRTEQLPVRSLVGLLAVAASEVVHRHTLDRLPRLSKNLREAAELGAFQYRHAGQEDPYACLSLVSTDRLHRILDRLLDPDEFLSPHGPRSLSKFHLDHPVRSRLVPEMPELRYEPGVSDERIMGGNSNWRGPVWFPTSYLLIQALRLLGVGLGRGFTHPFPAPEGRPMTLQRIADRLAADMVGIFRRDRHGRRPLYGSLEKFQTDPTWRDDLLFHEFFDGDSGFGLGASHQTGWTALVALMVEELAQPWSPPQRSAGG